MKVLETLLEVSLYSVAIFLCIAAVKTLFKKKLSPMLHYAVWALLVLRLILPITMESPVHFIKLPAEEAPVAEERPTEQPVIMEKPIEIRPIEPVESTVGEGDAPQQEYGEVVQPEAEVQQVIVPEAAPQEVLIPESKPAEEIAPQQTVVSKPEKQKPAIRLTAEQILMGIWLLGVGIGLAYIAAAYFMMRRALKRGETAAPRRLIVLYETVKAEMGIEREIPLICSCGLSSPGLMFPGDVVIPPEKLTGLSDESVRLIFKHELTHYKRGDQLVCMLLSLLTAVYWFNPVVWIASAWIRKDMETACDSAVVTKMCAEEKRDYAALIIELLSRSKHTMAMLGMAEGGVKTAKKRIQGIFMKGRSKMSAKIIAGVMSVLLLICCFTTACTPIEKPAEEEYAEGRLPQETETTEEPLQAPEEINHYKDTIVVKDGKLTLNIDASVTKMEKDSWPVYKTQLHRYTAGEIGEMMQKLVGDVPLKNWEKEPDKQYYLNEIVTLEEQLKEVRAGSDAYEYDSNQYDSAEEMFEERIAEYTELMDKAPAITEYPAWDDADDAEMPRNRVEVFAEIEGRSEYCPWFSVYSGVTESEFKYCNTPIDGWIDPGPCVEYFELLSSDKYETTTQMDRYEAIEKASVALGELGLDDFVPEGTVLKYGYYKDDDVLAQEYELAAHGVVFTRAMNGNKQAYLPKDGIVMNENGRYTAAAPQESLIAVVNENGLQQIEWTSREDIVGIATENADILDFSEISPELIAAAAEAAAISTADLRDPLNIGEKLELNISMIDLVYAKVRCENTLDEYETVPAWTFYDEDGRAIFAINAVRMVSKKLSTEKRHLKNILLFGVDDEEVREKFIMLFSTDLETGKNTLLNIPWELYADGIMMRTGYTDGDAEKVMAQLEGYFSRLAGYSVKIDGYILTKTTDLKTIAEQIGGVDVTLVADIGKFGKKGDTVTIDAGNIESYFIDYKTTGGGHREERRQQYVLAAIEKLSAEGRLSEVVDFIKESVNPKINLTAEDRAELAEFAEMYGEGSITGVSLSATPGSTDDGWSALFADEAELAEYVKAHFAGGETAEQSAGQSITQPKLNGIAWKEEITAESGAKFYANLTTEATDAAAYPIYQAEKKTFTSEEIEKLAAPFIEGATGMRDGRVMTKEQLQRNIDGANATRFSGYKDTIKYHENDMKTAPNEKYETVSAFPVYEGGDYDSFYIYRMPDGAERYIRQSDYSLLIGDHLRVNQLDEHILDGTNNVKKSERKKLDGERITEQEATAKAEEYLRKIGIEDFSAICAEKATMLDENFMTVESIGWNITFNRTMDAGIPVNTNKIIPDSIFFHSLDPSLRERSKQRTPESIRIYTDADGVQEFEWYYPLEITGVSEENAPLLPFDQINTVARAAISKVDLWKTEEFEATRAALTYKVINNNGIELRPMWIITYKPKDAIRGERSFAIDAVDGHIVNFESGAKAKPLLEWLEQEKHSTTEEYWAIVKDVKVKNDSIALTIDKIEDAEVNDPKNDPFYTNAEVLTETVEIPMGTYTLVDPHNEYRRIAPTMTLGEYIDSYEERDGVPFVFCSKHGQISLMYEVMLP